MDRQSEDEDRALDAKCAGSRRSGHFRAAVSKLKALPPDGQTLCIVKYALHNLPHLLRCALTAGISSDTRFGENNTLVLCLAAKRGKERALEVLLVGRANSALADSKGWTAAHFAAFKGHAPCLRLLLDAGAPKDAKAEEGWMPLHLAAQEGHAECCSLLLASGCNINAGNDVQTTPLHCAAMHSHLSVINLLLDAGAQLEAKGFNGRTALYNYAFHQDNVEAIRLLLARGANPNAVDDEGYTPLMNAILRQHTPCVRALLPFSDLSITNQWGRKALHVSIECCNMECFELLLPLTSDVDERTVQGVMPDGSQIGVFNVTPLHQACSLRQHMMTRNLLRRGASRSPRDSNQITPLHRAAALGDMGCVAILLGEPAKNRLSPDDVNAADDHSRTALHYAAFSGVARICGVLLVAGARIDAVNADANTPLMIAQQHHPDKTALLELLLLAGYGPTPPPGTVCDCCGITDAETRLYTCTSCSMMRFCGRDCLRAAWPAHKAECRRLKAAWEERGKPAVVPPGEQPAA